MYLMRTHSDHWRRTRVRFWVSRLAFTLVELLVVIAIIGILVALLLPAIQAARESARKVQCRNNLKQIAMAFLNHESAHRHLPTSGWGYKWVGDPDAGYGVDQPGGWAFNILEFLEEGALRKTAISQATLAPLGGLGGEGSGDDLPVTSVTTPLAMFNCPSKRPLLGHALDSTPGRMTLAVNLPSCTLANGCLVSRGDYRANSGSINQGDEQGPPLFTEPSAFKGSFNSAGQNGITYQRSKVRIARITDGSSKTALVGEKYLNPDHYLTGDYTGDDQCLFSGHDNDNNGYTANGTAINRPEQDNTRPDVAVDAFRFGGPHAGGLHMAYCDGSVQTIAYDVDDPVWRDLGGRDDNDAEP